MSCKPATSTTPTTPARRPPGLEDVAEYLGVAPSRLEQASSNRDGARHLRELERTHACRQSRARSRPRQERGSSARGAALRRLSPFEAWVICERFGFGPSHRPASVAFLPGTRAHLKRHVRRPRAGLGGALLAAKNGQVEQACSGRSYIDMGRECGLSVFRLRQVEKTALDKLRAALAERMPNGK